MSEKLTIGNIQQLTKDEQIIFHDTLKKQVLKCEWHDSGDEFFSTNCKQAFCFNEGGPIENGFKFCPYCGNEIEEVQVEANE